MSRFRTDVEDLLLSEMVEEDRHFIMYEDGIDGIIPENTESIFGDSGTTSSGDNILDDEYEYEDDDLNIF